MRVDRALWLLHAALQLSAGACLHRLLHEAAHPGFVYGVQQQAHLLVELLVQEHAHDRVLVRTHLLRDLRGRSSTGGCSSSSATHSQLSRLRHEVLGTEARHLRALPAGWLTLLVPCSRQSQPAACCLSSLRLSAAEPQLCTHCSQELGTGRVQSRAPHLPAGRRRSGTGAAWPAG